MAKKKETNEVRLESGQQKTIKTLSKILEVFAIIGRVCAWIGLVCVILVGILTPILFKDITINKEEISYKSEKIEIREENDEIALYYKDSKIADFDGVEKTALMNILDQYSAKRVEIIVEAALISAAIVIVISLVMLKYEIKLFRNIHDKETPFIEENTTLLKKIGKTQIVLLVVTIICSCVVAVTVGQEFDINFNVVSISTILGVYLLAYIFEYGTKLQSESKVTLYDEEK